jgi:phage-related protein
VKVKIFYYPDNPKIENRIKKYIEYDLKKNCLKQWRELDFFLYEIGKMPLTQFQEILSNERSKKWDKRRITELGKGLYEYRGKQSREGTIRIYFFIFNGSFFILDAELKTDDKNAIDKARRRMKEMQDGV